MTNTMGAAVGATVGLAHATVTVGQALVVSITMGRGEGCSVMASGGTQDSVAGDGATKREA